MNNKFIIILGGALMILAPISVAQALSSEIHVTKDGKASVSSAKVMQSAGSTFFTRLYWGDSFVRLTIKTNSSTKFFRATGEATTIAEMSDGDLLDATGELASQSDTLTLIATSVKNSSVQKEQSSLSGNVADINLSLQQFTLYSKERGSVTVKIATSTQFFKGTRTLDLEHLRIGDRITKTSGDYDIPSKTLKAQSVTTYINLALFKPRLFIGKLAEAPTTADATFIKITLNKVPHTIFMTDKTLILRSNRSTTTLQRFVAGDTIRLFGTMREIDEPVIDATVIRNIHL